jgi:hypothetical protein
MKLTIAAFILRMKSEDNIFVLLFVLLIKMALQIFDLQGHSILLVGVRRLIPMFNEVLANDHQI